MFQAALPGPQASVGRVPTDQASVVDVIFSKWNMHLIWPQVIDIRSSHKKAELKTQSLRFGLPYKVRSVYLHCPGL